jgi:hypothetical protein
VNLMLGRMYRVIFSVLVLPSCIRPTVLVLPVSIGPTVIELAG